MGLIVTTLYIVIHYISLSELVPALVPYRIQLILATLAVLASFVNLQGFPFRKKQTLYLAGFFLVVLASRAVKLWVGGVLGAVLEFLPIIIVFFLLMANGRSLARLKFVIVAVIGCSLYYVVRGIMALYYGYETNKYLLETGVSGGFSYRMRGMGNLSDPNDMAQLFMVGIALLSCFWAKDRIMRNYLILLPLMMFLLFGVTMTKSRGALVTVAVMMMAWMWHRTNVVVSAMLAGALLVLMVAANFTGGREIVRDESRVVAWGVGLKLFATHPVLGVGWNSFEETHELTAHNSYILCLAELGTLGFFLWMGTIVYTFMQLQTVIKYVRGRPGMLAELERMAVGLRLALITFLVSSWFLSRTYTMTIYLLLALATLLVHQAARYVPEPVAVAAERTQKRRLTWTTLSVQFALLVGVWLMIRIRVF